MRNVPVKVIGIAAISFVLGGVAMFAALEFTDFMNDGTQSGHNHSNKDNTRIISGTVTRVSTDCAPDQYLNESGEIVTGDERVTCDDGSSVVVDGTHVRTASGLVPSDQMFNKHNDDWQPGAMLRLRVTSDTMSNYTMDCKRCNVLEYSQAN